jgi:hypothetical protein
MSPPNEQLVRDYLNRLSQAARAGLESREKQDLLERTRARIEAESGGVASASEVQVRAVLASLGDPAALAESEHARVASGAEMAASMAGNGSQHVPVTATASHSSRAFRNGASGGPVPDDLTAANGSAGAAETGPAVLIPRPGRSPESAERGLKTRPPRPAGEVPRVAAPDDLAGIELDLDRPAGAGPPGDDSASDGVEIEFVRGRDWFFERALGARKFLSQRMRATERFAVRLGRWTSQRIPEVIAVALLSVGAAMFPPIWFLGAIVALTSRLWDGRDKWIGLAVPVLAVILGTVLVIVIGGPRSPIGQYAYEAWLAAGRLSRLMAVLGSCYLAWRLQAGRREPRQPPWNRPHKLG